MVLTVLKLIENDDLEQLRSTFIRTIVHILNFYVIRKVTTNEKKMIFSTIVNREPWPVL